MRKEHEIEQDAPALEPIKSKSNGKIKRTKTERELERDKNLSELSKEFAGSARKRGERNRDIILLWLIKWGWTTNQVIQFILNVERPRPADDFVKKGILEKIKSKPGWFERSVYILSPAGVAAANRLLLEINRSEEARHYNLHLTKNIPWTFHEHHIVAQNLLTDYWQEIHCTAPTEYYFDSFKTDYELDLDKSSGNFIPDFSVREISQDENNGLIFDYFHYEVELNEKTNAKLWPWAWARAIHLQKNPRDKIFILTPYQSIYKNYNKYFSGNVAKPAKFNGKPSRDESKGIYLTTDFGELTIEMLKKSTFIKTGGLRRAYQDDEGGIIRVRALSKKKPASASDQEDEQE